MTLNRPLDWPLNTARKRSRREGKFSKDGKPLTVAASLQRLEDELGRMDVRYPEINADFGIVRNGTAAARSWIGGDPGCVLRYQVGDQKYTLPCDQYSDLAQNIGAIAAHLEAVRAIERHGVATATQMMEAFAALPPARQNVDLVKPKRPWFEVLGVFPQAPREVVEAAHRALVQMNHPDKGGSEEAMREVTEAMAEYRENNP